MKEVTTRYVGLDVHKATISIAVADDGVAPVLFGTIANDATAVRKAVSQLKRGGKLVAAYEAGPTGYGLHRQLTQLGVDCVVVAPALIPRRAGDRSKLTSETPSPWPDCFVPATSHPSGSQVNKTRLCGTWSAAGLTPRTTSAEPCTGWPSSCSGNRFRHHLESSPGRRDTCSGWRRCASIIRPASSSSRTTELQCTPLVSGCADWRPTSSAAPNRARGWEPSLPFKFCVASLSFPRSPSWPRSAISAASRMHRASCLSPG